MSAACVDTRRRLARSLVLSVAVLAGCASGGSTQMSGSLYAGSGYYDPWYWGPCCYDLPVVVGPPPTRPPHVEHPIAKPPPPQRPMPAPRPAAGVRGGRR